MSLPFFLLKATATALVAAAASPVLTRLYDYTTSFIWGTPEQRLQKELDRQQAALERIERALRELDKRSNPDFIVTPLPLPRVIGEWVRV